MAPHFGAQRFRLAEKGENVGIGQQAAKTVEDFFAAAAVEQPVMHDGGAHSLRLQRDHRCGVPRKSGFTTVKTGAWYHGKVETRDLSHPSDPVLQDTDLPLRGTFHPIGFPLNLATNSEEVLRSAEESWGAWGAEFDRPPLELRVIVEEEGELAMEAEFRTRDHLFSVVADRHNYAVMDLDRLYGYAFVSRKTVQDHAWFRWWFLDTMGFFLVAQRYVMAVHAACVARGGRGILLAGESRAGKSTLAWACARAGWTYLSDDAAWLLMDGDGREVRGRRHTVRFRHDAPDLFPELQGYVSRVRPNGKLSIEVPTTEFPHIQTAARCQAEALVFLDRSGRRAAGFEKMQPQEALDNLMGELAFHRDETRARYREVTLRLLQAPAYRMRYKSLEEGIALLGELHERLRP